MNQAIRHNEQLAAEAFNNQAPIFRELFGFNTIVNYKRKRVRDHLLQYLQPGNHVLELNCGIGEDAIFLANKGYNIHATDISEGMLCELQQNIRRHNLQHAISFEKCSYTQLSNLQNRGPYDLIFSNFAGLNCTQELDKVLASFNDLLKPGGKVTMVVMPRICPWELLLAFTGKFSTAFRRLSRKGSNAHVQGIRFQCWYYNAGYVKKHMKQGFRLLKQEGLCVFVPPSYMEQFAEKHPTLYGWATRLEARLKSSWPLKNTGDYYIISFEKR